MVSQQRSITKACNRTFRASIIPELVVIMLCVFIAYENAGSMPLDNLPDVIAPPHGFVASGAPEIYGPQTLYRKINGQAELYLAAGFVALKSQWYESAEKADTMIEVNMYHMGSLLNAFSVFSVQQRENARPMNLTRFSYRTENAFYLVHGPYYVELVSTTLSDTVIQMITIMAEQFIQATPVVAEDIRELGFFPAENLVQGSISLISDDAFGFDQLDKVFTAEYTIDDSRITAYLSKRRTPDEARELVRRLHTYFISYGGKAIQPNLSVEGARMIEMMDTYDIMFCIDEYLVGVHEAPKKKQAEKIADRLVDALRERSQKATF
jgi:hypothetical protein